MNCNFEFAFISTGNFEFAFISSSHGTMTINGHSHDDARVNTQHLSLSLGLGDGLISHCTFMDDISVFTEHYTSCAMPYVTSVFPMFYSFVQC